MLDHWYSGLFGESADQAFAPSWDNHIDVFSHRDQFAHCISICRFDDLYCMGGQTGLLQASSNDQTQCQVRVQRLATATQNRRVAGF